MADKLKEIPAKILEWWNKFTTRQKSIIVGAAAAAAPVTFHVEKRTFHADGPTKRGKAGTLNP